MSRSLLELDKYVQTVLPNDLSRLEDHTDKLSRYLSQGQRILFQEEERDAKSTLRHLKSNLKILGNITAGLSQRDLREANKTIDPMRIRIEKVVHKFQEVCPGPTLLNVESLSHSTSEQDLMMAQEEIGDSRWQNVTMSPLEVQEVITPEQNVALQSAETLQKDLEEIQMLFIELAELAANQNAPIIRLEQHTEQTAQHIGTARNSLYYASKLKAAAFPVAGAIIGGMIGGPIGAVAGLKGAAIVGMGGVSIGAAAGWGIKKFHVWTSDRLHEKDD
ncbi:syntaxin-17 [Oopsacas minuta]|uniref:Syntaxin-17 n=1 Tax=Oopsacas minuta TaxID=111878 RepID=A0AAV7JKF8_9METZ|nr:syntaxin-17 [Oopsacas minuta]